MASLSTCHLGLWLGWQILLNLNQSFRLKICPICSYDFVVGLRLGPRVSLYFCLDKCTICLDHLANLFICISYNFLIFVSSTNFSTLFDISSSMIPFKRGQDISPLGLDNTLLARTIPPIGSRHCQDLLLTTSHRHP